VEWKSLVYVSTPNNTIEAISGGAGSIIWCSDTAQADDNGVVVFQQPVVGTGSTNFIGSDYTLRQVDLRFTIADQLQAQSSDHVRLMLFKQRFTQSAIAGLNQNLYSLYAGGFGANINVPIDPKLWKVYMDKDIQFMTGLTTNNVPGVASNATTIKTPDRHFRMRIPYRKVVTKASGGIFNPFLKTYLMAVSENAQCVIKNVFFRVWFTDE